MDNAIWIEGQGVNRSQLASLNQAEHFVRAGLELPCQQQLLQLWDELLSYWIELADLPVSDLPPSGILVGRPQVLDAANLLPEVAIPFHF